MALDPFLPNDDDNSRLELLQTEIQIFWSSCIKHISFSVLYVHGIKYSKLLKSILTYHRTGYHNHYECKIAADKWYL